MKSFLLQELSKYEKIQPMKGPRNRLKVLRAERGWSQLDVSRKAEFKEYRYWRIENGYEIPSDDERAALAQAFGVEEADVFPVPMEHSA